MPAKPLVLALWVLAALSVGGYLYLRSARTPPGGVGLPEATEVAEADELPIYFRTPDFQFTDQHGETLASSALEGKVWIGFIFLTNCPTGACPVMVEKVARLQEALPDERIHFVSFSVDPERDTPEVLANYAREVGGTEVSQRWHLLTGESPEQMRDFVRQMKLIVDDEWGHSTLFLLVDQQGNVRGTFGNEDPEGMTNLAAAAGRLLAE